MTKVIIQVYPTMGGIDEMAALRPIGRNAAAYQELLDGLLELALAADELGYWGLSHTEHHFHSEGLEVSPDPGLYNLFLGTRTKRLHHGQLGFVLPTHDPLRLAERTAMIDHMIGGRLFVGMTRGYQSRWVDVLAQRMGTGPSDHNNADADARNWELFREHFRLLKLAWTRDVVRYQGANYQVPASEGKPWPPAEDITARYGADGELDENGCPRGVSVVPRPLQDPHPPLFQGQSISRRTVGWCAREGVTPIIQLCPMEAAAAMGRFYCEEAQRAGRDLALGESVGLIRIFHTAATRSAAREASERYDSLIWDRWYRHFHFLELFRQPGQTGPVPAPGETTAMRLQRAGMAYTGTVDDVKREIERTLTALPVEYLVWHLAWRPMPTSEAIDQLGTFATEIMPEFGMTFAGDEPQVASA
jgi:alkanesulfonate monooxygenase SsuD/methylene tetrahydromethanopterin reductase-like flavin-dependent oxidoreductase (luciferase family)